MKKLSAILMICIATFLSINYSYAQIEQDTSLYSVELDDGNEFIGTKIFEDSLVIKLKTETLGEITIQKRNIKSISKVAGNQIVAGKYWFENPQATRYFFSPNSYGLRKGEGYYQNVWILFNQFAVGITDNISIGAGVVPLFLFAGAPTPVWLTPRISVPIVKDKFNVGGGALIGTVFGVENSGFGIIYGNTTFGSRDKNLNLGLGWGYSAQGGEGGKGGFAKSPTITLSGMFRTGATWYLITENYYIDAGSEPIFLISAGARKVIRRASLDFGLVLPLYQGQGPYFAVPWIGFVIPFGNSVAKQQKF